MSESEIRMLQEFMTVQFNQIREDIRVSRHERMEQVGQLHIRVNNIIEKGCAHRANHEEECEALRKSIEKLKERKFLQPKTDDSGSFLGYIGNSKWHATGLAAVLIAIAVAYVIAKTCKWI